MSRCQGMTRSALIAIGSHDYQVRKVRQGYGQRRETVGLVAVIVAKQYSQIGDLDRQ